jgi:rhodanese-related sulfurtransferase
VKKRLLAVSILIALTIGLLTDFGLCCDVPMMTKDQLKATLGNPDLVIFDLRLCSVYSKSDSKIKGAVRPNMGAPLYDTFFKYAEGMTLVLYCASPNEGRSVMSAKSLIKQRIDRYTKVYVLDGGWNEWLKAGYPTEKK